MPDPMTPERVAEIQAQLAAAHEEVSGLCDGTRQWRMRVPVDPQDSDAVLGAAIKAGHDLLAEVERLRTELALSFGPRLYQQVQEVLDAAHGTGDGDGAGHGVVADVALLLEQRDRARGIVAAVAELHAPIPCSHDGKDGMCCAFCCIDGYGDQTLYCTARHEASTSCHPCPTAALLGGSVGDE